MPTERLTTVTFDFWRTLAWDPPEHLDRARAARLRVLAEVLVRAGCPCAPAAIETAYERCGAEMAEIWKTDRDIDIREQVRLVFDCLEPGVAARLTPDQFEAAVDGYSSPALQLPPLLVPGAAEAVRRLAERGLRLGLISNTGRTPGTVLRRLLEHYGLARYFRALSYSDELGVRKPNAAIFDATLSALGARPGETLHVGDNPLDDVAGAKRFGLWAAHYAPDGAPPSREADLVVRHLAELPEGLDGLRV